MTLLTTVADARSSSRTKTSPSGVLLIVCAGVVLASLDLFIVNVALPQIARDLHARDLGELSWVLNAYAIVYGSLLVFFGRLADHYRRDRAFLLGVAVFTAVVGRLCGIGQCRNVDRLPGSTGRRGCLADPRLFGFGARLL